jgi:hypothetical protein
MTTYADRQGSFSSTRAATERQIGYIISLIDARAIPETAPAWARSPQHFENHLSTHDMTMAQASRVIDYLKAQPMKPSAPVAPAQLTAGVYRASTTGEGLPGDLYKVYPARGHGGMLAKLIIVDGMLNRITFEYAGAARRFVDPAGKLTLDEAKAFGASTGYCCNCGAELTDPESIAAGIGPVCATKF